MNCFRHSYLIVHLDDDFFPQLEKVIEKYDDYTRCKTEQWDGKEYNSEDHPDRESKACWIDDNAVYPLVDGLVRFANSKAEWNFDIDFIEPLQNTLYEKGDFYDWHIDESNWSPGKRQNGRVRKISFTILLNDEFEGGEFEIFTNEKHVVELKKKDIILFHADTPHRVREVTSGVRKSLVGWTQGPAYK